MRLTIILLLVSAACFGQGVLTKNGKVIGYKTLKDTTVFQDIKNSDVQPVGASNNVSVPDDGKVGASNPIEVKGDADKVGAWNPVNISDTPKVKAKKLSSADSLAIPIFSTKEVMDFLFRINKKAEAIKELELSGAAGYQKLLAELNKIVAEMDKKRKGIK